METENVLKRSGPDTAHATEDALVDVVYTVVDEDGAKWKVSAKVDKFDRDALAKCADWLGLRHREPTGAELLAWMESCPDATGPYETVVVPGNLLTTAGLNRLTGLLIAAGGQGYDATHARIGVGDDATAANVADTDLTAAAGSSHRQFDLVDTISRSNGVVTAVATFGTGVGNFHWQEWGIDNGTASTTSVVAVFLNHKVTDLGTKTSAASWVFTVTITIA